MSAAPARAGTVVWVEGPDSASFLQGLLSNDIAGLGIGTACRALLLDATGHIRVDLRVARTAADGFTLLTDADSGDRLWELLDEYHFSEDVEVLGPEPVEVVTYAAADAAPIGADLTLPGLVPGTVDAIGDGERILAGSAGSALQPDLIEAMRIAAGVPRFGRDITDRTLVHEAGLQTTAVSFHKGCFLGQETVARIEYRGGVKRRLAGLRLEAPAVPGAAVSLDGRAVGTLTSVARHPVLGTIALATLRTEASDGAAVMVAGSAAPAAVVALPFGGRAGPEA